MMTYVQLYAWVRRNAQHWLDLCGLTNEEQFCQFCYERHITTVTLDCGVVLCEVSHDGLTAQIHPLITDRAAFFDKERALGYLGGICSSLGVERLEAHVLENSGKALRRVLKYLGFAHEGTLRCAARNMLLPGEPLISIEIWSILRLEILEVKSGRTD